MLDYISFFKKKKNARNPIKSRFLAYLKAGDERIELPPKVLETPIIPFDQSPMWNIVYILYNV